MVSSSATVSTLDTVSSPAPPPRPYRSKLEIKEAEIINEIIAAMIEEEYGPQKKGGLEEGF